jgi:hypothetical protein
MGVSYQDLDAILDAYLAVDIASNRLDEKRI